MATHSCLIIIFTIALLCLIKSSKSDNVEFGSKLSVSNLGLNKEKLTHLKFYFHDIVSGKNPTAVRIAQSLITNASLTLFGFINMMDDPLTIGPDINSQQLVGKSQGIYASASQTDLGFLMVLNFVFVGGKYNDSTLSVLGRNRPLTALRELPIVGGSGVFRFSRGYAEARTHTLDPKTGDAVVEYNVYVMHY